VAILDDTKGLACLVDDANVWLVLWRASLFWTMILEIPYESNQVASLKKYQIFISSDNCRFSMWSAGISMPHLAPTMGKISISPTIMSDLLWERRRDEASASNEGKCCFP